jgi:ATP phosphoribosyltransferase
MITADLPLDSLLQRERLSGIKEVSGKRVATAYPGLVNDYLKKNSISADVVRLDGAVESSIRLGVADVIADVVSTGNTLKQAGLATLEM